MNSPDPFDTDLVVPFPLEDTQELAASRLTRYFLFLAVSDLGITPCRRASRRRACVLLGTANQAQGLEREAVVVIHPLAGYRETPSVRDRSWKTSAWRSLRHRSHATIVVDTSTNRSCSTPGRCAQRLWPGHPALCLAGVAHDSDYRRGYSLASRPGGRDKACASSLTTRASQPRRTGPFALRAISDK